MACLIPRDVVDTIRDLETLNDSNIYGIIVETNKLEFKECKPSMDNPYKFVISKSLEKTTVEDLQHALFSCRPCYLFLRCVKTHDDGTVKSHLFLVHFNATGALPYDRELFESYCPDFLKEIEKAKKLVIEDEDDLTEEWLREQLNNV